MKEELEKFGVKTTIFENAVEIECDKLNTPTKVLSAHNDHRIAMALAVLCTLTGGEIEGYTSVNKSYPNFFEELHNLGIQVTK